MHPAEKQCNYSVDTSDFATAAQLTVFESRIETLENKVTNQSGFPRWVFYETTTWICPVTGQYTICCIGGGGGCGQGSGNQSGKYSRGGCGYTAISTVQLTQGESIVITIGAGGETPWSGTRGENGGDTTFGSYVTANGGKGGSYSGVSPIPGDGASMDSGYGWSIPGLEPVSDGYGMGGSSGGDGNDGACIVW